MSIRELMQKRDALVMKMNDIVKAADEETRSLTSEESDSFDSLEKELAELDKTIEAKRALENLEIRTEDDGEETNEGEEDASAEAEERAFADFLRSGELSTRDVAAHNMTYGDNGAVVPQSIANKIIQKITEISPIYADANHYNVKGKISIPIYDSSTDDITVGFVDEFTTGDSHVGSFTSISLQGHLIRAIADISRSLINNSQFDIVEFVINRMALKFASFIEGKILNGYSVTSGGTTTVVVYGLTRCAAANKVAAAATNAVTADELITLQEKLPDRYKDGAYFIMSSSTRAAIRKLKDGQGNLLLNADATARWGYRLLGSDVYVSENMPAMAADAVAIYYVNPKGVAVQMSEDIEIDVLKELKAQQHANEVIGFAAFDADVEDTQQVACIVMDDGV